MKKFLFIFFILIFSCIPVFSEQDRVLTTGISITDQVPVSLMGTWRVVSKMEETNSPENFKNSGIDLWNLSRVGNVINLCNPITGASASIEVEYVKNNTVRFTKEGNYDNQKLTDTVEITLDGNKFWGKNYLVLAKTSSDKNSVPVLKKATYILKGDKIAGSSILEEK